MSHIPLSLLFQILWRHWNQLPKHINYIEVTPTLPKIGSTNDFSHLFKIYFHYNLHALMYFLTHPLQEHLIHGIEYIIIWLQDINNPCLPHRYDMESSLPDPSFWLVLIPDLDNEFSCSCHLTTFYALILTLNVIWYNWPVLTLNWPWTLTPLNIPELALA